MAIHAEFPSTADLITAAREAWMSDPLPDSPQNLLEPSLHSYYDEEDMGGAGVLRFYRDATEAPLRRLDDATLRASIHGSRARLGMGKRVADLRSVLLGQPISTARQAHERLTKVKALAVLSSDALSSVAYATDQILSVLVLAGTATLFLSLPIGAAILLVLILVTLSYRQTVKPYPTGGGSYVVAKDNLGVVPGLTAAAALMTDYVLTVAVSISAGVLAVRSALPAMKPYVVIVGVVVIALLVLGNLRGIRESGTIFAAPTYLFILAVALLITAGFVKLALGGPGSSGPPPVHAVEGLGYFLVLKAFSSGCTALTGVEAISNGVPAFKPPEWRNARATLTTMSVILGLMFVGITALAFLFHLSYNPDDAIISQLGRRVFGGGPIYVFITATTALILTLAANTSFSDFPRLLSQLARDKYAPAQFANLGDRLAFSNGIVVLGVLAALVYIGFQGDTTALIPLYAVGVFVAFTLSQFGMVARWRRLKEPGWRRGLAVNAAGGVATAVVLVITTYSKFGGDDPKKFGLGAWIICLLVPFLVAVLLGINRHYRSSSGRAMAETPLSPALVDPVAVVPVAGLNAATLGTLALARRVTPRVAAIFVSSDPARTAKVREEWSEWGNHVPLTVIDSPYRTIVQPLLTYLDTLGEAEPQATIMVFIPELVAGHWWHSILHNQTALRLKAALLFRPGTVVVNVPYHLSSRTTSAGQELPKGDEPVASPA
ncbi:MAG: APC family permease [Candidatus Dormibacteria bacterium]